MSELPIVWIVLHVKSAFRKKLDFSQSVWRSFLKEEDLIDYDDYVFEWHVAYR